MNIKDFSTIPSYIGYQINREGTVLDPSGVVLVPYTYENGYQGVTVNGKTVHVHTLLANTFIPRPSDDPLLEVNHKDGVKTNNALSNLEWVTRSENIIHAYKSGLRTDNQIVEVIDLRSDDVTEFYSIQECARHLGVSAALIVQYFAGKPKSNVFRFYFLLRKKGQPWPDYHEEDVGAFITVYPNPVIVRVQGKSGFRIFESIAFVARELGINEANLRHQLRTRENAIANGYVLSLVKDSFELDSYPDEIKVFSNKEKLVRLSPKKPIQITVQCTLTGQVRTWLSMQDFADYYQVKKNTVQKSVYLHGTWKNFSIKYHWPAQ